MIIQCAGEDLELLPQRALYWRAQRMLIVADIHFGKAASFRAKGLPVPRGTTSQNLQALEALLLTHDVAHILFLGDFLHAKAAHADATLNAMRAWRSRFAGLQLTLVRGNHDLHAGDPPADMGMHLVHEPYRVGPFAFCHHPEPDTDAYVLAGHVHPVFRLSGRSDSARLPCFQFGEKVGVLPSFGAFTGGHVVSKSESERIYLIADDVVFHMP